MGKPLFVAPKGMRDVFPEEAAALGRVEEAFRRACRLFGYREVRTPHLEDVGLFARAVGETTDIVEKEMYTLQTKGGDKLALRPENTAGVLRAYLEAGLQRTSPRQRFFYVGQMFRHESSQKKRWREFTQAGVECLGSPHPEADAEVVALALYVLAELGLDVRAELSTFGCPECRKGFRSALAEYFSGHRSALCQDCQRRLERNVFRLLDCKEPKCREVAAQAPSIEGFLDPACREHFESVQKILRGAGFEFSINPHLVRGLDYYNRTVFEIFPRQGEGRQDALGAGGRYDGLGELLGGVSVPAVGFALGVERIALELAERAKADASGRPGGGPEVYIAAEAGSAQVLGLAQSLRRAGISCTMDLARRRLGAQIEEADKLGARAVVLLGVKEAPPGGAILKILATGQQKGVSVEGLAGELQRELQGLRKEKHQ